MITQAQIESLFDDAPRSDKLFPFIMIALGKLTGVDYMKECALIADKINDLFGTGFSRQFVRDLDTYGLYEALIYLHAAEPEDELLPELIGLANVYKTIATALEQNRNHLFDSEDPNIQELLQVHRMGYGEQFHEYHSRSASLIDPTPQEDAAELARLSGPIDIEPNRDLMQMIDYISPGLGGSYRPPTATTPALVEAIGANFMFNGAPHSAIFPFRVAEALRDYQINPLGTIGRDILAELLKYRDEEMFGDCQSYMRCSDCGDEFFDRCEDKLASNIRALRDGRWRCPTCLQHDS